MNDLKWADVAHMYSRSGLVVEIDHPNMTERPCIRKSPIGEDLTRYTDGTHGQGWTVTPHLRHLEDMTEAQANELFAQTHTASFANHSMAISNANALEFYKRNHFCKQQWWVQWRPKEFIWLLANGFDMFGLIESGQAIRREACNG